MNTTLKFDRVILTKEFNNFKQVGDVFEIVDILEDSFLLRSANAKVTIGVVNFEDFEKHFVHEENYNGWTNWIQIVGFNGQNDAFYRTNHKRVQVKFMTDKVRAEASCNTGDDFNLSFGINLAYLRCANKLLSKRKAAVKKAWRIIGRDIAENEVAIKKMIDSLEA